MRIGVAHHLGWAVLVTATNEHVVVDRRRVELVDRDLLAAPVHHRGGAHEMHASGGTLGDDELEALVVEVRSAARRLTAAALDELVGDLDSPVLSISLRDWPADFPTEIARQRNPPFESQADSIMYRQILAESAADRGWLVHRFNAAGIEGQASALLGDRAEEVLYGPRAALGPPWNKDHRIALAATIVAARSS